MVAPRQIHCTVIAVPVAQDRLSRRLAPRPSDLVPWADPYIASLITRLQTEVRLERENRVPPREMALPYRGLAATSSRVGGSCELEIPWNDDSFEYEPHEDRFGDQGDDVSDTSAAHT